MDARGKRLLNYFIFFGSPRTCCVFACPPFSTMASHDKLRQGAFCSSTTAGRIVCFLLSASAVVPLPLLLRLLLGVTTEAVPAAATTVTADAITVCVD